MLYPHYICTLRLDAYHHMKIAYQQQVPSGSWEANRSLIISAIIPPVGAIIELYDNSYVAMKNPIGNRRLHRGAVYGMSCEHLSYHSIYISYIHVCVTVHTYTEIYRSGLPRVNHRFNSRLPPAPGIHGHSRDPSRAMVMIEGGDE